MERHHPVHLGEAHGGDGPVFRQLHGVIFWLQRCHWSGFLPHGVCALGAQEASNVEDKVG